MSIDWKTIEAKWQRKWADSKIFQADPDDNRPKFYLTVAYPYPNSPQHVGHGRTYVLTDVYARYMRMRGFNVLFPMAFHYTGTPVLAMSKRVRQGDKELMDDFLNIYHVPPEKIREFQEPLNIARYFHEELKTGMQRLGFSIDWRREFTTIDPPYSRFIEWQFKKLRAQGKITKGSHPVGWCPSCASPMGQHDTKGDVEPEIGEFTLIKFQLDDDILPAATLRPETVYGVTNLWIRPEIEYVRVDVEGESWIVSEECSEKLGLLNRKVAVRDRVLGKVLIGKRAVNPADGRKVPIIPAAFPDPKNATGIVMSVPAHSPADLIAQKDLVQKGWLEKYGLSIDIMEEIKPIQVVELEGSSEIPAQDILDEFKVKDQLDPNVEKAGSRLYSREFHRGIMRKHLSEYGGMTVAAAREAITADLTQKGRADRMYELLNRPIFCRCGGELAVKIFENQWFINYDDPEWKRETHRCLSKMRIIPEEVRSEFNHTIDWLKEKACARKYGLGTRLPWDPEWIIESLSDSVIYMAYYTFVRHIYENKIDAAKLSEEVFDYVLHGKGDILDVSHSSLIAPRILEEMRREFLYFYPLDSRNSGSDLVPNHLSFFVFEHVALFPEELWPRQMVVNNLVLMEGKKMSKSLGNIIPIKEAISTFGADPLRLSIQATAELLQPADFSRALAKSVKERLEAFYASFEDIARVPRKIDETELLHIDRWILGRLHRCISKATEAMDELRVREAINNLLYMIDQDIQWYIRRTAHEQGDIKRNKTRQMVLGQIYERRALMLAPFTPHLSEELWEMMGYRSFVSLEPWPLSEKKWIDETAEAREQYVKNLHADTQKIINVTGMAPKKITYYAAAPWKWKIYSEALKLASDGRASDTLVKKAMMDEAIRKRGRAAVAFIRKTAEEADKMSIEILNERLSVGEFDETGLLFEARQFLSADFKTEVEICSEESAARDPQRKAETAIPYRPAILIE